MGMETSGTSSSINCGSDSSLDNIFTGGGTIMGWVYLYGYGVSDIGRIADKTSSNTPNNGWTLITRGGGTNSFRFAHSRDTNYGEWRSPTNSLQLNTLYHFAIAYNKDSTSNDAKIYINGQSVSVTETSIPNGAAGNDASQNYMIFQSTAGGRGFDGYQVDHRAYDRILDDGEIETIYATNGHDGIHDGLVGRWMMNEDAPGVSAGLDTFYIASTQNSVGSGTSLALTVPSNSTNDKLIAMICPSGDGSSSPANVTTPSGWTLVGTIDLPATSSRPSLWVYSRVASSEPSSYNFIINQTNSICGIMASYVGSEVTLPEETIVSQTGVSINPVAPSTSISNNSLVLRICAMDGLNLPSSLPTFYPADSIHRNALEIGGVGNGCALGYAEQLKPPGSIGTATFTGFTFDEYGCYSLVLNGGSGDQSEDTVQDTSENSNNGIPTTNITYVEDNTSFRRRV